MGSIGLWLWSNPSKFGTSIGDCDPSLTVVGGAVPFSSLGLRVFSLAMYCLLVIPGLNLVLPFLFFLALHIRYNKFRRRRSQTHDSESAIQLDDAPSGGSPIPSNAPQGNEANHANDPHVALLGHTAFLIVGLGCLALINIILLVDIELTLRRNKHNQSREEDEWGFGQVLALLLLVVPLCDFVASILKIRKKVESDKHAKDNIQKTFEENLLLAVRNDTFDGHDFKDLIERGADPKVPVDLKGASTLQSVTLLQFAAYKGNEVLVEYLIGERVEDNVDGNCVPPGEALDWLTGKNNTRSDADGCGIAEGSRLSCSSGRDRVSVWSQQRSTARRFGF
ncbi:hypothetical protein B0H13DRAFT_2041222 [Mycena leptocephala]|nr:hypothetical protein B0H13DRAFT_2041222 [Mycena leptocephala]